MANPPVYPTELTKTYWDKKKGLLAKMAGKTGVGDIAKKAEDAHKKIVWSVFNITGNGLPTASNPEALAQTKKYQVDCLDTHKKLVMPTIKLVLDLAIAAENAGKAFAKNKLVPKDAVKLAKAVEASARSFADEMSYQTGPYLKKFNDDMVAQIKSMTDTIAGYKRVATETKQYMADLQAGIAKYKQAAPEGAQKAWLDFVKQPGRSVSNNLKVAAKEIKDKHYKFWIDNFKGFDWDTLQFGKLEPGKLKSETHAFCNKVITACKALEPDLP
jgi:hypothetical protein